MDEPKTTQAPSSDLGARITTVASHSVQHAPAEVKGAAGSVRLVPLAEIVVDGQTYIRSLHAGVVDDYAAAMKGGAGFPPVVLFNDGEQARLADGRHRLAAAKQIGRTEIMAEVRPGGAKDALWYALGANRAHGLRLDTVSRRIAISIALRELTDRSHGAIAAQIGVSQQYVSVVARQLTTACELTRPERTIGKDGKSRPATRKATTRPAPAALDLPAASPPVAPADPAPAPAPAPAPVAPVDANENACEPTPPAAAPSLAYVDDDAPHDGELPCPFCGAATAVGVENRGLKRTPAFVVHCWECEATGPYVSACGKAKPYNREAMKAEAVRLWNTLQGRVQTPQAAPALVTRPDAAPAEPAPVAADVERYRVQLLAVASAKPAEQWPAVREAMLKVAAMLAEGGAR